MRELDYQDCRHYGHDCDGMTADRFPEVMATFYNGVGDFVPWKPSVSHRGGVYAGGFDMTVGLLESGWTIRYTLDGSDPHKGGQTSAGPLRISKTSWLRVIGVSPDGKQQSRENLQRYTIPPPWPATTPGNEPGLTLRAYGLGMGGRTPVQDSIDKIQKGSVSALAEAVVSDLGEAAEPITRFADQSRFFLYTGTITIPETGVCEFEVNGCDGLFFPQRNKPWKEIGRSFAAGIGTYQIHLEKGSHQIMVFQVNKSGRSFHLNVRESSQDEFRSVPADWYRH